jgi:Fe-S-cluster containining protein
MERTVPAWRSAAAEPAIVAALESLYAEVGSEIAARGPVCWASGRCCNFERAGHRLYATGLETAYTLSRLAAAAPPARHGLTVLGAERSALPLTAETLDGAIARGGCPFQSGNLCSAHAVRPLGCRVYFCDRSAQTWQNEMYERAMGRLRSIHDEHGVGYLYGEWRGMLRMFLPAQP